MPTENNPYTPPQAPVRDIAPAHPQSGALARRSTRLWATLVDFFIALISAAVLMVLLPAGFPEDDDNIWAVTGSSSLYLCTEYLLFLLLNGWLLFKRGQTIGKAIFKLRIVRTDGSAASLARLAGLREGVAYIAMLSVGGGLLYWVVDSLFIFSPTRRCLHDRIAGTIVVHV